VRETISSKLYFMGFRFCRFLHKDTNKRARNKKLASLFFSASESIFELSLKDTKIHKTRKKEGRGMVKKCRNLYLCENESTPQRVKLWRYSRSSKMTSINFRCPTTTRCIIPTSGVPSLSTIEQYPLYGIKCSLVAARFNTTFAARRENEMWFAE
jgi:hypothetical protein